MARPAIHVATLPRRLVLAKGLTASTMPCVPPFLEMIPTRPPSRSENTMIWVCPPSTSPSVGTAYMSMVRQSAESGLYPATANAPSQTPARSAVITSLKINASRIARIGGARENQPGAYGRDSSSLT